MNGDAWSDAVLAAVCFFLVIRYGRVLPGLAIAVGLIGLAATFGILRFSGWDTFLGPHRFTSLFAACTAFPLLALVLRWPDAPSAVRATAAVRFALIVGGVGIALSISGISLWSLLLPGASAILITWTMIQRRNSLGLAGAAALLAGFAAAAAGKAADGYLGVFNHTQFLHYCLAVALFCLVHAAQHALSQKLS